jgi:tripartite-type tricarboxylate transporter receptor subunit TctC
VPVADFVPGYEASFWAGIGAPRGTSAEIIDSLNREINAALVDVEVKRRFDEFGGLVLAGSPAEFGTFIAKDTDKWGKVVKFTGLKPE